MSITFICRGILSPAVGYLSESVTAVYLKQAKLNLL